MFSGETKYEIKILKNEMCNPTMRSEYINRLYDRTRDRKNEVNEDANQKTNFKCSVNPIGTCWCLLSQRKHFMPEKSHESVN